MFGDDPAESFDTLFVDARYNNSWPKRNQASMAQYTRDQFACDLQNAMAGGYAPHGRKVHLYINGLYWGLYWIHERPDESFAAAYSGGKKDDYDTIKHNPDLGYTEVINGTD